MDSIEANMREIISRTVLCGCNSWGAGQLQLVVDRATS
jgi:hypothetical protein